MLSMMRFVIHSDRCLTTRSLIVDPIENQIDQRSVIRSERNSELLAIVQLFTLREGSLSNDIQSVEGCPLYFFGLATC